MLCSRALPSPSPSLSLLLLLLLLLLGSPSELVGLYSSLPRRLLAPSALLLLLLLPPPDTSVSAPLSVRLPRLLPARVALLPRRLPPLLLLLGLMLPLGWAEAEGARRRRAAAALVLPDGAAAVPDGLPSSSLLLLLLLLLPPPSSSEPLLPLPLSLPLLLLVAESPISSAHGWAAVVLRATRQSQQQQRAHCLSANHCACQRSCTPPRGSRPHLTQSTRGSAPRAPWRRAGAGAGPPARAAPPPRSPPPRQTPRRCPGLWREAEGGKAQRWFAGGAPPYTGRHGPASRRAAAPAAPQAHAGGRTLLLAVGVGVAGQRVVAVHQAQQQLLGACGDGGARKARRCNSTKP